MAKELGISESEAKPNIIEGLRELKKSGIADQMKRDVDMKA